MYEFKECSHTVKSQWDGEELIKQRRRQYLAGMTLGILTISVGCLGDDETVEVTSINDQPEIEGFSIQVLISNSTSETYSGRVFVEGIADDMEFEDDQMEHFPPNDTTEVSFRFETEDLDFPEDISYDAWIEDLSEVDR